MGLLAFAFGCCPVGKKAETTEGDISRSGNARAMTSVSFIGVERGNSPVSRSEHFSSEGGVGGNVIQSDSFRLERVGNWIE